jgi:Ion channel
VSWLRFAVGALILVVATLDPLWTTIWVDGHAGPLTRRYGNWIDRLLTAVIPRDDHRLLSLAGPVVLIATVTLWALLAWTGWVVLFSADPGSLVDPHTRQRADLTGRIYFTGYTMFTLGNGDFAPQGGLWQIASALASLSGLFLLTLSVTYVLAVIEAVVAKRSFASQTWALAHSAEELVEIAWNGRGFPAVELQLLSLTEQLNTVTEQHQAYPMLHYYHEERLPQSVSVNLAIFDEALTIWEFLVPAELRPAPATLKCARDSVREFLNGLRDAQIEESCNEPPWIDLAHLRESGLPVSDHDALDRGGNELAVRRRHLLAFLEEEHREWPTPGRYP